MPAGTRTFGVEGTLIEPKVLPPPPTRHALFVFLLTLALILHLGTAGWNDIHNGVEGVYASAARATAESSNATVPLVSDSFLLHWLMAGSFKLFGVKAAVARFPLAGAMVASIALTFLIGERIGGYWRGFVAGLIHLCCLGSFIWGRIVTPAPLFAALLEATIFCAVCGYQRQQKRRLWFAAAWVFSALGCLAVGLIGLVFPALIFILLAAMFRQARIRFRPLLHWSNILIFVALTLPLFVWSGWQWPVATSPIGVPLANFLPLQALWLFPVVLLILPGIAFAWKKIFRPHDPDFADALPLCWMAVGLAPTLFLSNRQHYDMIPIWGAFALFSACAWERMPRAPRLAGIGLVALAGIALASSAAFDLSGKLPAPLVVGWRTIVLLLGLVLFIAAAAAGHFSWRDRETLAIAIILLGMVPVGLTLAEGMARMSPQLSFASAAQFLRPRLGESGEVLYEGSAFDGSSLGFYLERPFQLVDNTIPGQAKAMEKLAASHPVYLIIHRERVPYWQEQMTGRFHMYHQEMSCGRHVIASNLP